LSRHILGKGMNGATAQHERDNNAPKAPDHDRLPVILWSVFQE
jgi:hypothetical protein